MGIGAAAIHDFSPLATEKYRETCETQ